MVSTMPTSVRPTAPIASTTVQKQPAKPLLRRSTLSGTVRRRDETDIDMDAETNLAIPNKRSKVAFDPEVKVRLMEDWASGEKAPELIHEEVRRGIERYIMGETAGYERIKEIFTIKQDADDAPSPTTIKSYLLALLGSVSLLKKSCSSLVHVILECQWLGRDEAFVAVYVRFLGILVSARGGYVGSVLRMLVSNLCHGTYNFEPSEPVGFSSNSSHSTVVSRPLIELFASSSFPDLRSGPYGSQISAPAHPLSQCNVITDPLCLLSSLNRLQKSTYRLCPKPAQSH